MRCPKCGYREDKVIDSRPSRDGASIRRRRVCLQCSYRFTTYEEIDRTDIRVVKRDRTQESFDRRKLAKSLALACEKRPVDLVTLEQAVDDIIHEVETNGREISTAEIGTKALAKLRDIDEVAYVRYASVHRRFEELEDFMEEVKNLGRRVKSSAAQRELFPAVDPKNHGRV